MRLTASLITLGLALLVSAPAFTQDAPGAPGAQPSVPATKASVDQLDQNVATRTRQLLSGYHGLPDREALETSLEQPRAVLEVFARDDSVFPLYRKQALRALGFWADDGVREIYENQLEDSQTREMTRHMLLELLAVHYGEDAIATIRPFLAHQNVQFRLTAVEALRQIPSERAFDLLRKAKKEETNEVVLEHIAEATRVVK